MVLERSRRVEEQENSVETPKTEGNEVSSISTRYLYRGVNSDMYERTGGCLLPKVIGEPFERSIKYGQEFKYGEITYGKSAKNAIVAHQRNSSAFPSSGVSTTPVFENAKAYALHNGRYAAGYVFRIDTELLETAGVRAYEVSEYAAKPAIPEDKEIILVAEDFGVLPRGIVVEVIEVKSGDTIVDSRSK
ncbi:MAG: hypothetical protein QM570_21375 [Planctomycetota bacterium]|jgi:hypothetical protein|nr:hypothetical protein [Planctomycetota bacterium]